jgi:hypothetical protein
MSTASQTSSKTAKAPKAGKSAPKTSTKPTTKAVPAKTRAARKPRAATAEGATATASRKASAKAAPVRRSLPKPPKPTAPAAEQPKQAKTKLVRDSFTMPKSEYAVIDALKQRSAQAGRPLKKSEVLRAGVKALAAMADADFAAAIGNVQALKTGRPKSKKAAEPDSQE